MGERGPGPPLERIDARRPLKSGEVEINRESSRETGPRPGARRKWLKALPILLLMSGLSGISAPSVASAQSEALQKGFLPIVQLWKRGKTVCANKELPACVDITKDVMKRLGILQNNLKHGAEKVLVIGARALMAAGINEARAVVAYQVSGADTACILLGNAQINMANADDALSLLPPRNWQANVKRHVSQMKRSSNIDRRRLGRIVPRVCPSNRIF